MKEAGMFALRVILKSLIVAAGLVIIFFVFDTIRDEVYYTKVMKEAVNDSVSPVTRGYKDNYDITNDTAFIRKLENETKKYRK